MFKFKSLFLVFFIALISNISLLAQYPQQTDPPPCIAIGCNPNDWWIQPILYSNFCQDCDLEIWVKYNPSCNEIYILYYQFVSFGCINCVDPFNWHDINRRVVEYVLENLPIEIEPYGEAVKISEAACWKEYEGAGTVPGGLMPCELPSCCKRTYFVSPDPNNPGKYIYTFVSALIEGPPCDEEQGCTLICEQQEWFPVIKITEKKDDNNNSLIIDSSPVPNPTTGLTEIKFECKETGKVKFILTNINGSVVMTIEEMKDSFQSRFNIDTKQLSSGAYLYQIMINDRAISQGSISVSK